MLNLQNRIAVNSLGNGALGGLAKIVSDYGFLNAWSSENLTIAGTTTTANDYLGVHDLVNPAAGNQPTYSASDANFNSKPSFTFDGVADHLTKNFANYRGSDSSGVVYIVVRPIGTGNAQHLFSIADTAGVIFINFKLQSLASNIFLVGGSGGTKDIRSTNLLSTSATTVIALASTGTGYKIFHDGVSETLNLVTGTNDGDWIDTFSGNDNITINGLITNTSSFSANDKSAFWGYAPYVDDATIIATSNALKTHYGI